MNNERVKILSKLRLIHVILASVCRQYRCEGIVKRVITTGKNVPLPCVIHAYERDISNRPDIGRRGGNANVTNSLHTSNRARAKLFIYSCDAGRESLCHGNSRSCDHRYKEPLINEIHP